MELVFDNKLQGVSNSTSFPVSRTIIRSESIMVFNLWAIVITVQSLNSILIVSWIKSSVSKSIAAVASSKISIFVFLNNALTKQISCFCPADKFRPPSAISSWSPAGNPGNKNILISILYQ